MGGKITELILLRASLVDALMITLIVLPFLYWPRFKKKSWLIIPIGIVVAVGIEWWALRTGRWSYNHWMPIIPLLSVGLTPALQLGILGYLSYRLASNWLHIFPRRWILG